MLQLWALSCRWTSIGNTCIISCRHVSTSINLNRTKLLSDLFIRETLTTRNRNMYTSSQFVPKLFTCNLDIEIQVTFRIVRILEQFFVTKFLHNVYNFSRQQQQQQAGRQGDGPSGGTMLTPILGAMLGDGPIRMITQGQELTSDVDEKTLAEMQFKDMQVCSLFTRIMVITWTGKPG